MVRLKKEEKTPDFTSLMARSFSVAEFKRLVSKTGLPDNDKRKLCKSFEKMKG